MKKLVIVISILISSCTGPEPDPIIIQPPPFDNTFIYDGVEYQIEKAFFIKGPSNHAPQSQTVFLVLTSGADVVPSSAIISTIGDGASISFLLYTSLGTEGVPEGTYILDKADTDPSGSKDPFTIKGAWVRIIQETSDEIEDFYFESQFTIEEDGAEHIIRFNLKNFFGEVDGQWKGTIVHLN